MVLSVFGARLVQLQGVDPHAYAAMAAAEGTDIVELPAERGDILDRNGKPLADSVDGAMVVADPELTRDKAPELAKFLAGRLDVDYFETLKALRLKDKQFAYIARRVPASKAEAVVAAAEDAGFDGLDTRHDPVRDYPAGDVAANLIGFMGTDEATGRLRARTSTACWPGTTARSATPSASATGSRSARPPSSRPSTARTCNTTIDLDLQWYVQRVLRQTREDARADSAFAVVLDTQTGEVLALADDPTFDARDPRSAKAKGDLVSRAMTDVYEPGSVEKVLTLSALIDAGKATDTTRVVVPSSLVSGDRVIHDWFSHDTLYMTLAGVVAQSSNIGTVLASRNFETGQLREYLTKFGLGQKTNVGIAGETQGILPDPSIWTSMTQDRIAFGQSLSVNAMQMAAAVNTIANGGVRVSPSLIRGHGRHRRGSAGRHRHRHHRAGGEQEGRAPDDADDGARGRPRRRRRAVRPDPGLPGGRQDRHRPARRPRVRLLQQHLHRLLRGLRPGRRAALHGVRRGAEPPQRWGWRLRRRSGVRQDHELRAQPLRRPADRLRAVPAPDDVEARTSSLALMSDPARPLHPPHRPLTELAAWLAAADPTARAHGDLTGSATGVTLASQRVLPGDVYAALSGSRAHGMDYVASAVDAGAVAVLTDSAGAARAPSGLPVLEVDAPRSLLGRFAAHVYGEPARSLRMLGVTGTQGKTTTTRLAESALQRAGVRAGVIGTVGTRVDAEEIKTALTTPEAPDLHALFAMMKRAWRRRLRHGGLQPRARAGSRRRRRLRRRGLHQPGPRPPRLPRRRRGLLRGQGVAVHPRARASAAW